MGFPHRGFPKHVEDLVLKNGSIEKRTIRAGLTLTSIDFEVNKQTLSKQFDRPISDEQAMSSLMYPKVFSDFIKRIQQKGSLLPFLPSPVYFYALSPGDSFLMTLPVSSLTDLFITDLSQRQWVNEKVEVKVELVRVGPLSKGSRSVYVRLSIIGNDDTALFSEEQSVEVKDSGGVFVFEGPMADASNPLQHVASPMPGVVEKLLVKEGQQVAAVCINSLIYLIRCD